MPQAKKRNSKASVLKLSLIVGLSFVAMHSFSQFQAIEPDLGQKWRHDMVQGTNLLEEDPAKAALLINEALESAKKVGVLPIELMAAHRRYAKLLYKNGNYAGGDAEIQKAIESCPRKVEKYSPEANLLTHLYQDRGWSNFNHYLDVGSGSMGIADMEKSVSVASTAFGLENEQTIFKIPSLALIYSFAGKKKEAHKLMDGALAVATTHKDASVCAYFVYNSNAWMKLSEHDYKGATASFEQALKFARDAVQVKRIWNDFSNELERQVKSKQNPELQNVATMFHKSKYEQMDQLAERLLKAKTSVASGSWKLDMFFDAFTEPDEQTNNDYQQTIFDLRQWMKQHPQSATARVALADGLVEYAWLARGGGYADKVKEEGWRLFGNRLTEAKSVLDEDSAIKEKSPKALSVYSSIAIGQGWETTAYEALLEESHKLWPDYLGTDFGALHWYLPRWHGNLNDTEGYIIRRANMFSGGRSDEVYAQLVASEYPYLENVFTESSPLKWDRVKSGFKQIFADYPKDLQCRLSFVKLCRKANDPAAVKLAFNNYKP